MKSSEGQKHVRNILEAPVSSTEHHTKEVFITHCWPSLAGGSGRKNLPANAGDARSIPGSGRSPGGGPGNPRILAWRIPRTEKPGRLQSIGSQRVRHDCSNSAPARTRTHTHTSTCMCQVLWKRREQTRLLSSWSSS